MAAQAAIMGGEAALQLGAGLFQNYAQQQSADSEIQSLRMQKQQEQLQAAMASNQRLTQVQKIISAQNAAIGASGVTPDSFSAVQTNTFNQASQDQKTADLNLLMKETAIDQNINNINQTSKYQEIGNLFDVGQDVVKDFFGNKYSSGGNL